MFIYNQFYKLYLYYIPAAEPGVSPSDVTLQVQPINRPEQLLTTAHQATAPPPPKTQNAANGAGTNTRMTYVGHQF